MTRFKGIETQNTILATILAALIETMTRFKGIETRFLPL